MNLKSVSILDFNNFKCESHDTNLFIYYASNGIIICKLCNISVRRENRRNGSVRRENRKNSVFFYIRTKINIFLKIHLNKFKTLSLAFYSPCLAIFFDYELM